MGERERWRITVVTTHDVPGWCGGNLTGTLDTTDSERLLAAVNEFAGALDGIAMITPLLEHEP